MMAAETVETYFSKLEDTPGDVARALRRLILTRAPHCSCALAWGFPCWTGKERVISVIAHRKHCNLQLWNGARFAADFPGRIEGSGKYLRHVKVRSVDEIDDELVDIVDRALELDRVDPVPVR